MLDDKVFMSSHTLTKPTYSLRGSLAAVFMDIKSVQGDEAAHQFVHELLDSDDPDILCTESGFEIIIGRESEIGMYAPNW